ncbi:membrane-bound lytic murein transglycosylase MltF [Methylogaea oryzae]|uniref:Membrane-bound lytic murein transglycosylase F n=1 Tax=Methylogaea oryzae TaxID=1295382 RepID=A0A8D5AIU2_9GAMM|nr:membrane-bound lytic murein transglycosylase MltF [Methylogaea oryzae]BBL70094.1 membrane-bound lytic murein transglycosylase F [Methylogaea oryzae]
MGLDSSKLRNRVGRSLFRMASWLLVIGTLCGCTDSSTSTQLEKIKHKGTLTVATRIGPATYHPSPNGLSGIEHDLAQLFAQRLGVEVKFVVYDSIAEIFEAVEKGRADVAAAGLAITDQRKQQVRFTPAYRTVTEQVVYRDGTPKPRSFADLSDGIFEVSEGGSHLSTLERLRDQHPELQWRVSDGHSTTQLMYLVHAGLIDYTTATSDQTQLIRRYLPQLRVAFDLGVRRSLAWAFRQSTTDSSLYDEAVAFFNESQHNKTLDELNERYYGNARVLAQADDQAFRQHVHERLPQYRRLFHQAANRYGLDWRLLAAIAYQESKWDPGATSPTGVRGMMMLTEETAKELNVKNRLNPRDSIMGGAYYVSQERADMPVHIAEPDRTWMALVAYNAGPGMLEKARHTAQRKGQNPDRWLSVKKVLAATKGYYRDIKAKNVPLPARQSVEFVESVRRYYDLLVYLTDEENFRLTMFPNAPAEAGHSS